MPSSPVLPASGVNVVAAGQVVNRYNLIVSTSRFGAPSSLLNKDTYTRDITSTYVVGLPRILVSILLFPEYDRGDITFRARNYLSWRIVGTAAGSTPGFNNVTANDFVPLNTPQLLPVGQPISTSILAGGLISVAVEFDTTSYPSLPIPADQGSDRVIVTITASQ